MRLTRREWFHLAGSRGGLSPLAAAIAARGFEAERAGRAGEAGPSNSPDRSTPIKINSNENPLGPGPAALDAIVAAFDSAGRYPANGTPSEHDLAAAIASSHGAKPEQVVLGAGSQEVLASAVRAFTSASKPLVTASPTFENCTDMARRLGHPVRAVRVDAQLKLDLDGMLRVVDGAGLVFLNNPNNPTATVHGIADVARFVEQVRRRSPGTAILIDEAYHDYVTDPGYQTAIKLALATPNVFVTRTFSKAYGMAGLRVGYAIGSAEGLAPLRTLKMSNNVSVFGVAAAVASLNDPAHIAAERTRNTEARTFTADVFRDLGCEPSASNCNFIFVDIGRSASGFRDACARSGVNVGRDFPPFAGSHTRISIGTMAEMKRAAVVFRDVLGSSRGETR